jgi:hypothetical protein
MCFMNLKNSIRSASVFHIKKLLRNSFSLIRDVYIGILSQSLLFIDKAIYQQGLEIKSQSNLEMSTYENLIICPLAYSSNFLPMQAGEVVATYADVASLHADTGFEPKKELLKDISHWADWCKKFTKQYA